MGNVLLDDEKHHEVCWNCYVDTQGKVSSDKSEPFCPYCGMRGIHVSACPANPHAGTSNPHHEEYRKYDIVTGRPMSDLVGERLRARIEILNRRIQNISRIEVQTDE